ncbi:MAG: ATP-binding protein, partial [Planctomycetota bacterium]
LFSSFSYVDSTSYINFSKTFNVWRMFDAGFSTKSGPDATGKGGSGLGLSACREIVDGHRGRIRVESAVGRGTAVTIRLPVSQPAAAA